ncbi:MAG: hypothetical protein MR720_02205 [Sutterella sp.]|nr:hypothetical protein [Sutterella sp.]
MISRRALILSGAGLFITRSALSKSDERSYVLGSTLLEDIVSDLTTGRAKTRLLISGSACPGHTDVKASDLVFAANAQGIYVHPRQMTLPSLTQLFAAKEQLRTRTHGIGVSGSWLIPDVQIQASRAVAKTLVQGETSDFSDAVYARLQKRIERIKDFSEGLESVRTRFHGKPVVSALMQKDFVSWCGFSIAATFGGAESMNPKILAEIIALARKRRVIGVVENLQSGKEAGLPIAEELKIPRAILSNFPGSDDNVPDYFSLVRENIRQLLLLTGN